MSEQLILIEAAEVTKAANGRAWAIRPIWARANVVEQFTGVGYHALIQMVAKGQVRMRKNGTAARGATCLFKVQDVLDTIKNEWDAVSVRLEPQFVPAARKAN